MLRIKLVAIRSVTNYETTQMSELTKSEIEIKALHDKLHASADALYAKHPELDKRVRPNSGWPGITWQPKFKAWVCHAHSGGKTFHVGLFKELPDAIEALKTYRASLLATQ